MSSIRRTRRATKEFGRCRCETLPDSPRVPSSADSHRASALTFRDKKRLVHLRIRAAVSSGSNSARPNSAEGRAGCDVCLISSVWAKYVCRRHEGSRHSSEIERAKLARVLFVPAPTLRAVHTRTATEPRDRGNRMRVHLRALVALVCGIAIAGTATAANAQGTARVRQSDGVVRDYHVSLYGCELCYTLQPAPHCMPRAGF
jgi:hypothetical protein